MGRGAGAGLNTGISVKVRRVNLVPCPELGDNGCQIRESGRAFSVITESAQRDDLNVMTIKGPPIRNH